MDLLWMMLSNFFPDISGEMIPLVREPVHHDWFFLTVSGVFLLLAFVRVFAPRRFVMILAATLSLRKTIWLRDDGNVFFHGATMTLFLVSITIAALYAYSLLGLNEQSVPLLELPQYIVVGGLTGAFAVMWLLKDMMIFITGRIFKSPASSFLNMVNKYVLNVTTSLLLLVFVILDFYLENEFYIFIPLYLIGLIYIYRLIRTFMIGRKVENFLPFYIILYLCTLEILPVLLLFLVIERYLGQIV